MGSGWAYVPSERSGEIQKSALAIRITSFSLAEALILCFAAIFCMNYFSASAEETAFDMAYILSNWRENLRIGLTLMCAAVPVAYLFNVSIMKYVVYPINAMAFLMERYFSVSEQERVRALPNLNIHTGDEVERLYHSLQKMVVDMALHIDQRLEQERRFARLTREFMLALAKAVDAREKAFGIMRNSGKARENMVQSEHES